MSMPSQFTNYGAVTVLPTIVSTTDTTRTSDHPYLQVVPQRILIEQFYFTDDSDNPITATGGTVAIATAPLDGVPFHHLDVNASFNAADADAVSRIRPRGVAIAFRIRIILTGIVVPASPYKYAFSVVMFPVRPGR